MHNLFMIWPIPPQKNSSAPKQKKQKKKNPTKVDYKPKKEGKSPEDGFTQAVQDNTKAGDDYANGWRRGPWIIKQDNPEYEEYQLNDLFWIQRVYGEKSTRLPTHPLETGTIKHDHKIEEPRRVTVIGHVAGDSQTEDSKTFAAILEELVKSTDLQDSISLISPMESYKNLYLASYKNTTEDDKIDLFSYTLTFQELFIATGKEQQSNNANYASSSDKGGQGQGRRG